MIYMQMNLNVLGIHYGGFSDFIQSRWSWKKKSTPTEPLESWKQGQLVHSRFEAELGNEGYVSAFHSVTAGQLLLLGLPSEPRDSSRGFWEAWDVLGASGLYWRGLEQEFTLCPEEDSRAHNLIPVCFGAICTTSIRHFYTSQMVWEVQVASLSSKTGTRILSLC